MVLFYVVFSKLVPIISIWEMKVGQHPQLAHEHQTSDEKADDLEDAPMTAIYGLFDKPDAAQRAYTGLKRAGVASRDITVISGEPFEAFEFSHRDHSMILFRLALVGGIIGFVSAVLLDARHRAGVAARHRRHAGRRVVAEPGHHLRDDDARRHRDDGRLAARGVEAAVIPARRCTIPRCPTVRFWSACRSRAAARKRASARRSPRAGPRR